MVKDMEPALLPRGSQSPESEEWEPVEKSLEEMVNKRRMKVERLERELDAYRKHYAKLVESFSFPTFPTFPEARGSKKRQSSRIRNEAEIADGGEIIEKATSKLEPIPSELPPSSKAASIPLKTIDLIDLTDDNEIDILKDTIRRARPSKSKTSQYVTSQAH